MVDLIFLDLGYFGGEGCIYCLAELEVSPCSEFTELIQLEKTCEVTESTL